MSKRTCPKCGSDRTHKIGFRTVQGGKNIQKRQCINCGHTWSDEYVRRSKG